MLPTLSLFPLSLSPLLSPPCVCVVSVCPPSPSALRALSLRRPPDEAQGVSGAHGVLSFLQSSTRRAYQQLLEVLDENQRR